MLTLLWRLVELVFNFTTVPKVFHLFVTGSSYVRWALEDVAGLHLPKKLFVTLSTDVIDLPWIQSAAVSHVKQMLLFITLLSPHLHLYLQKFLSFTVCKALRLQTSLIRVDIFFEQFSVPSPGCWFDFHDSYLLFGWTDERSIINVSKRRFQTIFEVCAAIFDHNSG